MCAYIPRVESKIKHLKKELEKNEFSTKIVGIIYGESLCWTEGTSLTVSVHSMVA